MRAEDCQPRLRLLVHPRVGPVDSEEVARTFLLAIDSGSGGQRVASVVWRDGRFLQVERRNPLATGSGKILHLHLERSAGVKSPNSDG